MSDGWSRIRIFNPSGLLIDEVDLPTTRSWVLNSQSSAPGRCQFTVPVYSPKNGGFNPKCNINNFQYGNLILIEHKPSVNADETQNGLLPPWVGVIMTPQTWQYGTVNVTAYSAEWILSARPVGPSFIDAKLGGIVSYMLQTANSYTTRFGGGILVQPGQIDTSGYNTDYNMTASVYEEIQSIVKLATSEPYFSKYGQSYDWEVVPVVSPNNQLQLFLNFVAIKGVDTGLVISNSNLQNTNPLYTEQGTFYNVIIGFNDASTRDTRVSAFAINADSVAISGVLAGKVVFPGTQGVSQDVIQSMANAYLATFSTPTKTFAPTVLDQKNAFSYCVCGNTMIIQNNTVGFQDGRIGINTRIRITAVEYNDISNVCKLAGVLA